MRTHDEIRADLARYAARPAEAERWEKAAGDYSRIASETMAERDAALAEVEQLTKERDAAREWMRGLELRVEKLAAERDALAAKLQRVRDLHHAYPIYDECPHIEDGTLMCEAAWEADNGVYVCGPVTHHVCEECSVEDGEGVEWPCPTIRALDGPQEAPEPAECSCHMTDPKTWDYVEGNVADPASQWEPNPECPVHFPTETEASE